MYVAFNQFQMAAWKSFPAQYSHLLLYIWADLHYGEQAAELVLTTQ